jgi:poly(hydroxyalkanoate) depolymerase family esterase
MTKIRPTMAKALRLTRAGNLNAATQLIQSALMQTAGTRAVKRTMPRGMNGLASIEALQRYLPSAPATVPAARTQPGPKALKGVKARSGPGAGSFAARSFSGPEGALAYWLYLPSRPVSGLPVVIMLHGCSQTPEDFARGTQMNLLAEELGFIVAYPGQTASANMARCWNWFKPGDQQRDRGEPARIAALARTLVADHDADASRVYVAGLSAGGAAAAILGAQYPDIFAAIGVHSGLACGAAKDMTSAFAAMRNGSLQTHGRNREGRFVPVITFHGDNDATVHPINSAQIGANAVEQIGVPLTTKSQRGGTAHGRTYTRELNRSDDGKVQVEQWTVHGASHAWAGGNASGSYTDHSGPDASRAMANFFLQHSLPELASAR